LPASSSFVLAAARLRALQPDPGPRGEKDQQLRGRIQKNGQPSPAARSHRVKFVCPLDTGGPYGCRRQGLLGSLWCWHSRPSCMRHGDRCPWRRSWSRVTAQGVSGSPGRDARMPPGPRGWIFGWPGCMETLGDPGPGGTDASPGFIQREPRTAGQVPGMSRWSRPLRSRVARGVRLPGTSAPCPAVTLSDTGGQGERAHSRRRRGRRLLGWLAGVRLSGHYVLPLRVPSCSPGMNFFHRWCAAS
jgi:hypothetical protein